MSQALLKTEISHIRNAHKAFTDCCSFFKNCKNPSLYDFQSSLIKYRPILSLRECIETMKDEGDSSFHSNEAMERNMFWDVVVQSFNSAVGVSIRSSGDVKKVTETMLCYVDSYLQSRKYKDIEHTFIQSLQDEGFGTSAFSVVDSGLPFLSREQRHFFLSRRFEAEGFLILEPVIVSVCKKLEEYIQTLDSVKQKLCVVC